MRKRILAVALALTMAMPMTAMAAQRPIALGEFAGYTEFGEKTGIAVQEMLMFDVVDAGTFWTSLTPAGTPMVPEMQMKVTQAALDGLSATHDIYYTSIKRQYDWGVSYGSSLLCEGIEVDGQRFESNDAATEVFFSIDESGRWYNEEERLALGVNMTPYASGQHWPITINGQTSQVVYFDTMVGKIWAVPKSASSVRELFGQTVDTEGVPELNGASWGRVAWEDAYYIDLKTGQSQS